MKHSVALKTGAIILISMSIILSVAGGIAMVILLDEGVYEPDCTLSMLGIEPNTRYYDFIKPAFENRYLLTEAVVLCMLLSVILFVYLMCSAGHCARDEQVRENFIDKIPFDIYSLILVPLCVAPSIICIDRLSNRMDVPTAVIIFLVVLVSIPLAISYFMSIATRIKTARLLKNTAVAFVLKYLFMGIKALFKALPNVLKAVLLCVSAGILELFLMSQVFYGGDFAAFVFIAYNLILLCGVLYLAVIYDRIYKGTERFSNGSLENKIDTTYMVGSLKRQTQNLNKIGDGLEKALETKMKSERFKTELITNVSHDLKTPLTSIINYVDLIKKEKTDNDKLLAYIDVLDKHSRRLKKLTEDVVEASKAASGSIKVNLEVLDIVEMLGQSVGEYQDKFENKKLYPVVNLPQTECKIYADGRLTFRVMDNLLNNICKYSMEKTRIYIELCESYEKISVSFKNISASPLNVSPEELMERFVRADASRHTEGSGLGLSIAKSLCELMQADFELEIDADLFCARVSFKKAD